MPPGRDVDIYTYNTGDLLEHSNHHNNSITYIQHLNTQDIVWNNCTNYSLSLLNGYQNFTNCANVIEENFEFYAYHPVLGILLTLFAIITIGGNLLVMIVVARERYLRTVTNYFIVSLALADLIIGAAVMPFGIVLEMTNQYWMFGPDWCDLWHSVDVLASTASILNLSMISLDRYWAITDPIAYPSKMSTGRACVLIALVWICSASISFPAIIWWRSVAGDDLNPDECMFTDDRGYLLLSSVVSFYVPIVVIMFAYYKIYQAATEQTRSLKTGSKVTVNGSGREVMTLRMHRGGGAAPRSCNNGTRYHSNNIQYTRATVIATESESDSESPQHRPLQRQHALDEDYRPSRMMSRKWKHFALSKKLSKLAKEQKAAKTLGIVMGVFCICWVPFFVTNLLFGLCRLDCVPHAHIVFPVFNWLGYINSGMNPIIYALSMRDFRRAFSKVLCCCPSYRRYQNRGRDFDVVMTSTSYAPVTYNEKHIQSQM